MSVKSKNKNKNAAVEVKSLSAALGCAILFFAISAFVCGLLVYAMSGAIDGGWLFALLTAVVCGMCWYRNQASVKTLCIMSLILGIFMGLFVGVFEIGAFFAAHDGFMELNATSGLEAIGLATGVGPLDAVRHFLMGLFFSAGSAGMVFGISFAGILDLFISIALYVMFMMFMVKRLRRSK